MLIIMLCLCLSAAGLALADRRLTGEEFERPHDRREGRPWTRSQGRICIHTYT